MKKLKRNFDDYNEQASLIDRMSILQINEYREKLKKQITGLDLLTKEEEMTKGRKSYLKGKRMIATRLLAYTKIKLKLLNVVIHNGTSKDLALIFVKIASEELPLETFQKIYGLSVMESDEDESTIESVRRFVKEFKDRFTKEGI